MDNSVVNICDGQKNLKGTGFVIDLNDQGAFVVTTAHVIDDCNNIEVNGLQASINKNQKSDGLDLALLFVEGLNLEPLRISLSHDEAPSKVLVTGYSRISPGKKLESINVDNLKKISIENEFRTSNFYKLIGDEKITKGYSGSPVVCRESNTVIGVITHQGGEDNLALSSEYISNLHIINDSYSSSEESIPKKNYKKISLDGKFTHDQSLIIETQLKENLDKSLESFSGQPNIWVEPQIHYESEYTNAVQKIEKIEFEDLIKNPRDAVIVGRQQYGLTSLAHKLVHDSWVNSSSKSFWLYLDAHELKPYKNEIEKYTSRKLNKANIDLSEVECVILDEFSNQITNSDKLVKELLDHFDEIPIVIMLTTSNVSGLSNPQIPASRAFTKYYLWALPRFGVRNLVSKYNHNAHIGDEDLVVEKLVSDLEALNIPRTPINCITMLKIYEQQFDESPVNRTEVIHRVLYLLFDIGDLPVYKSRPDLKDTEFVLGYFCEQLLKNKTSSFSRDSFIKDLKLFCSKSEIDLEIDVIFDVLYKNNIIVQRSSTFCFKFSYWVYYFAAHRMHHNSEFATYMLTDMAYASYPELIEFYTGIDRHREDALVKLTEDISTIRKIVETKCGIPGELDIYDMATWNPDAKQIEKMHEHVSETVRESKLPEAIKDQYADKTYNRARPLNQELRTVLENYSLMRLMNSISAGSRALRNSDYSNPEVKHKLLREILLSWEQLAKVLVAISPILATRGSVSVDGASFTLVDEPKGTLEQQLNKIIQYLPDNIISWYKNDIFSVKMSSLIYKHGLREDTTKFLDHLLKLLIIRKRPKNWDTQISEFIDNSHKNSFYLFDVYSALKDEYRFGFISQSDLPKLEILIKMCAAKHQLGVKRVNQKTLKKVPDKVIPERDESAL
ncbi:MAG: serine protease [Methylophaga sp.]